MSSTNPEPNTVKPPKDTTSTSPNSPAIITTTVVSSPPKINVEQQQQQLMPPPLGLPPRFNQSGTNSSNTSNGSNSSNSSNSNTTLSPLDAHRIRRPKEQDIFPLPNGPQRVSNTTSSTRNPIPGTGRSKVQLEPGHSPLDWARLTSSGKDLRGGINSLQRFTLSDLSSHNTEFDCWMAIQGKVYNVTAYLPFHPGGKRQLMRGAGKDATELFMKIHPWVNVDMLLDKCFVGYLI